MLPRKPLPSSQCNKAQGLHFQITDEGETLLPCRLTDSNRDHLCHSSWQSHTTSNLYLALHDEDNNEIMISIKTYRRENKTFMYLKCMHRLINYI